MAVCDSVVLRTAYSYVLVMNPFLVEPLNVYSVGQHIFFCFMKLFEIETVRVRKMCKQFSVFFSLCFRFLVAFDGFVLIRLYPQRIPVFMPKHVVMIPKHISYAKLLIAFLSY